ncbi:MAG TPA: hypothetical protein VHV30_16990 [Polyangiaceae bacterium]|jgi:hypothetical protein|nr:hypothetical protein [Polyangiaceae bacterium]
MRRLRIQRRLAAFLALAAALHAATLAFLPEPARAPTAMAVTRDAPVDLEGWNEPAEPEPLAPDTPTRRQPDRPAAPARRSEASMAHAASPATGGGATAPAPREATPGEETSPWSFSPLGATGIDVMANHAVEDVARKAKEPVTPATTGGVAEALAAHDRDVGIGRAGPLLEYVEAAAHDTMAPDEGTATFDVAVEASGRVSVALLDASSDEAGWTYVAHLVEHAVDVKRVRLPEGAGWHAVVRVEAKAVFPNGVSPKTFGTKLTARSGHIQFTTRGKICSLGVGVGVEGIALGGGCDFTNAGARLARVVHGQILSDGRL